MDEFMQGGQAYQERFIKPLDAASAELRKNHARLIGHRW
jgi:hypothetical protein